MSAAHRWFHYVGLLCRFIDNAIAIIAAFATAIIVKSIIAKPIIAIASLVQYCKEV